MKRIVATSLVLALCAACNSDKPRALVLADGTGQFAAMQAMARTYEATHHRAVHVIEARDTSPALSLAARGEAEVVIVPDGTKLDDLVAANQAKAAGVIDVNGVKVLIVEVTTTVHPKVDGPGAHDLATYLASR